MKLKVKSWKNYAFEFLSIFVAVISAFALNNWNDHRRDRTAERKILEEINNGLMKDAEDIRINLLGHEKGIASCRYWTNILMEKEVATDSFYSYYFGLTRDFFAVQNKSGYESLKSRGLEIIENDALRFAIISLYEYDYFIIRKFEEDYAEMQFHQSFSESFNKSLAPYYLFDEQGNILGIEPVSDMDQKEKNILLANLEKIKTNRKLMKGFYQDLGEKVLDIQEQIKAELEG